MQPIWYKNPWCSESSFPILTELDVRPFYTFDFNNNTRSTSLNLPTQKKKNAILIDCRFRCHNWCRDG